MKTRWLFTMRCLRGPATEKRIETEEHITAETWEQALEYWKIDIMDEATEILSIVKQVPVLAHLPQERR